MQLMIRILGLLLPILIKTSSIGSVIYGDIYQDFTCFIIIPVKVDSLHVNNQITNGITKPDIWRFRNEAKFIRLSMKL